MARVGVVPHKHLNRDNNGRVEKKHAANEEHACQSPNSGVRNICLCNQAQKSLNAGGCKEDQATIDEVMKYDCRPTFALRYF